MKQGEECRDRKNGSRGVVLMERLLGACSRGFEESSAAVVRVARQRSKERARGNIQRLFQVGRIPTDTTLRRRLDEVRTADLGRLFRQVFQVVQKMRLWSLFQTAQGELLLVLDGTQVFSSKTIHCAHCRVAQHRDGTQTYSHQIVSAVVVHPDSSASLPLASEPIGRADGAAKNDCEHAAAQRLLRRIRADHPKLRFVVLADALYATGPMIQLIQELGMNFLLAVKPRQRQQGIYTYAARSGSAEARWHQPAATAAAAERYAKDRGTLTYRCLPQQPLNGQQPDLVVWVVQCQRRTKQGGQQVVGEWISSHRITPQNAALFVRYARRRWLIENCIFKTMKAQTGMNFEHNFGHGKQALCDNFAQLMMLATLLDQLCHLYCQYFQAIRSLAPTWARQWERQRTYLFDYPSTDWQDFYRACLGLGGVDPPTPAAAHA